MRHGRKVNHLGRKTAHRKAMLSNMATSLLLHKRITTTVAKAKALRVYVEPILTKSKTDSTHSRRMVFSELQDKEIVTELFRDIAPKIANRNGGYTRIIRLGYRLGDNAEMCMIELVDFNDLYSNDGAKKTTRRSRRGSGGAKKTEGTVATDETTDIAEAVEVKAEVEESVAEVVEEATAVEETVAEVVEEAPVVVEEVVEAPVAEEVVEVAAEAPAAEEAVEVVAENATVADDLTIIEGVGPVIAETLVAAGLVTFADVAASTPEAIAEIIADVRGNHITDTWPKQAQMAADGQWDELKKWQEEMDGGKPE
jgi:large subunit ribosomal protein L17